MEKPTWVKVIGILGIIFGCTGILGSLNTMVMPKVLMLERTLFELAQERARFDPDFPRPIFEALMEMFHLPAWVGAWAIVFGALGVVVAGFYLFSAISLLQVKPYGVRLMTWALGLSILLTVVQIATILGAPGLIPFFVAVGGAFSIIIDLVMLAVIITADKSIFTQQTSATGQVGPMA